MNIQLPPELEQLVHRKMETGIYNSASEVVSEALRLMEERDQTKTEIREKIAEGVASARAGRLTDGEAFFAQLDSELDAEIHAENEKSELRGAQHR